MVYHGLRLHETLDLTGDGSYDCASKAYGGLWIVRHAGSGENNEKNQELTHGIEPRT